MPFEAPIEDLKNKIEDIQSKIKDRVEDSRSNFESNISRSIAKSFAKPTDEIKDPTLKDRLIHSALGGIAGVAIAGGLSGIFKSKFLTPLNLAGIASAMTSGYFIPDIVNTIREEVKGDKTPGESTRLIRELEEPSRKASRETEDIAKLYSGIFKKSSFIGGAKNIVYGGIKGTAGLLGKGLFPRTGIKDGVKTPFSRKILSYGVRGGALAGAGYGGYKGIKHLNAPISGNNYTTFLRNQILAGNVNQGELSQRDLVAVRKLGMR